MLAVQTDSICAHPARRLWQHDTGRLAETIQLTQTTQPEAALGAAADRYSTDPAASQPMVDDSATAATAPGADAATEEAEPQQVEDGADGDGPQQDRRAGSHPAVLAIAVSPTGCVASAFAAVQYKVEVSLGMLTPVNCTT